MRNLSRLARPKTAYLRRGRNSRAVTRLVEGLESRCLLSSDATATPLAVVLNASSAASSTTTPAGLTPAQVQSAYGFSALSTYLASVYGGTSNYNADAGKGTTIAIVDAYDDPNILNDVNTFSQQYGLPTLSNYSGSSSSSSPTLDVVAQTTQTDPTGGWEMEEALDVEWAHAIAPAANIVLVEAPSTTSTALLSAVNTAKTMTVNGAPVVAVSMSWGINEFSGETALDSTFTTTANDVTFVAAAGDTGAETEWPAISPNVLSVGGTTMSVSSTGVRNSEVGWTDSGGGTSSQEQEPLYQASYTALNNLNDTVLSGTTRGNPDVSYNADPNTGYAVYDSYPYGTGRYASAPGWVQVGGTSSATPQWAALVAVADGVRIQSGQPALDGPSQVLPALYSLASNSSTYSSDFYDITSGSTIAPGGGGFLGFRFPFRGSPPVQYNAQTGYDLVTGLGSPDATNLVPALASVTGANSSVKVGASTIVNTNAVAKANDDPITLVLNPVTTTTPTTPTPTPTTPTPTPTTTTTTTPASTSTSTTVVMLPATASSGTNVVLIGAVSASTTGSANDTSMAQTTAASNSPAVSVLTAAPTSPVRPPQPLLGMRQSTESESSMLPPVEDESTTSPQLIIPAFGWDYIARDDRAQPLDLPAILRRAEALGRVAAVDRALSEGLGLAPPRAVLPDDLDAREVTPTVDPILAGLVVTLGVTLALRPDRPDARRRPSGPAVSEFGLTR